MVWMNTELMSRRRLEVGMTKAELAVQADLDIRTVQRLEKGQQHPHLASAIRIAKALQLEPSSLLFVNGPPVVGSEDDDHVLAAFEAADEAIQTKLTLGGTWGLKEATSVLCLLLTRYGSAFARQSVEGLDVGLGMVQMACDQAKRLMPHYVDPEQASRDPSE